MRHYYTSTENHTVHGILERVAELNDVRLIEPSLAWQSWNARPRFPAELSTSYGDWNDVKDHTPIDPSKVYLLPAYCGGCDYGNSSLVEVSNHRALIDMFPAHYEDGEQYISYHGDFGTFDIAIRLDALTDEVLQTLEALQDYPLIDESLHSELEIESQNESWESAYRSDFRQALGKYLAATFEGSTGSDQREDETDDEYTSRINGAIEFLEDGARIPDDSLTELFMALCDRSNTYWENEQGSDSYIDVDRVVNRGLERKPGGSNVCLSEWQAESYTRIQALLQASMGDDKYTFGIVRYVNPAQMSLDLSTGVN